MEDKVITNPAVKAGASIASAAGAQFIEAGARGTSVVADLFVVTWANIASALAVVLTLSYLCDFWWKRFWRPLFESRGWIQPKVRRKLTASELADLLAGDTDPAPLR